MLLALLPALTVASTQTISFESHEELERAVSVGVRSAVASGWTLVDVSPDYEQGGIVFTLTRSGTVERHLALLDGKNTYRVESGGELPERPTKPSELLVEALQGRGGIEIASGCSGFYERPYVVDDFAIGGEARELVGRSLAAAADLESASMDGERVVFQLETRERDAVDLVVTLTDDGDVAEAELRRYDFRADNSSYRRRGAMAQALRRAFVSSIHQEDGHLVLRTSRGRFPIDPDGDAFRSKREQEQGEHEYGCGCGA